MAIFYKKIIRVDTKTLKYGAILGALLCGIFIALVYGVKNTNASTAGFLTSTTVVLVPILQMFITRKLPSKKIVWGVVIVSTGLALLLLGDEFNLAIGALYCLLAAFLYAIHIIVTNRFVQEVDALKLGIYQLGFATLFATGRSLSYLRHLFYRLMRFIGFAILGLALLCSAYGLLCSQLLKSTRHLKAQVSFFA